MLAWNVEADVWRAAGAQARWQSCYQHVMVQLKYLLNPGSVDGSNAAVQRVQHLGADGQQAFRKVLLQVGHSTAFLGLRARAMSTHLISFQLPLSFVAHSCKDA